MAAVAIEQINVFIVHSYGGRPALTLDCATPSAFAEWRKFKYSATASVWISDTRGMRDPSGVGIPH